MPDKIHQISLSFLVDKLQKNFGGTASNIAYTLKLMGIDPILVTCAGNDFEPYVQYLKKHRISSHYVHLHNDIASGAYFVVTDGEDNQIGSFYTGASRYNKLLTLPLRRFKKPFVVVSPNAPGAMKRYVRQCKKTATPYMYDPAFQIAVCRKEDLREGIAGAAILIGNDYEIALIEDRLGIEHDELLAMGPIVVSTLGRKGSLVETSRESIHIKPAKPKNTTDPTGAGDAYRAGFIAGFVRGFDLGVCGHMGSVAAVYTVELYGTMTHHFTKKEFVARYRENFGQTLPL